MGIRLLALVLHLRHRFFHGADQCVLETAPGEVYLRCTVCMLRSPGLATGPMKVRSFIAGDPARHRQPALPVGRALPPAVAVEDAQELFSRYEDLVRVSDHVH